MRIHAIQTGTVRVHRRQTRGSGIGLEQAETSRPFILRILDAMAMSGVAMEGGAAFSVPEGLPPAPPEEREYEAAIAEAIQDVASQKKVVIVGHGAGIPMALVNSCLLRKTTRCL